MISYLVDLFLCSMVVVAELVGTIILAIAVEVIVYKIFKINLCQKIWKGLNGLDRKLNKILGQKGGKKMEVFIGVFLGFIIAIIVMKVTGFGQDYELITTIDELQKELKHNKDRLKNKEIAEIRATFFARKIKEIEDIIKNSEESKENYFITFEKIKNVLFAKNSSNKQYKINLLIKYN